jgi:hypothetical protein
MDVTLEWQGMHSISTNSTPLFLNLILLSLHPFLGASFLSCLIHYDTLNYAYMNKLNVVHTPNEMQCFKLMGMPYVP